MSSGRHRALLLGVALCMLASCSRDAASQEPVPSLESYCAHLDEVLGLSAAFDQLDLELLDDLVPKLRQAVAVAPAEALEDTRVVADYATDVLTIWQATDPLDPVTARQAFIDLDGRAAAVEASGKALEAFALEHCELDLLHPPTTTTTIPPTTAAPPTTEAPTTEPADTVPATTAAPVYTVPPTTAAPVYTVAPTTIVATTG